MCEELPNNAAPASYMQQPLPTVSSLLTKPDIMKGLFMPRFTHKNCIKQKLITTINIILTLYLSSQFCTISTG